MSGNPDTKLIVRQDYTYHVLDDPGLVHYTQGLMQYFVPIRDYNELKEKINEDVQTKLDALQKSVEENNQNVTKQLGELQSKVEGQVQSAISDLEGKLSQLETKVQDQVETQLGTLQSTVEQNKSDLEARLLKLETDMNGVKARLDTLI